jgi:hypothetical protein
VETDVGEALGRWETFYVITGAAAAALTGLQFVVVTLINDDAGDGQQTSEDSLSAFGTPTVVHFAAALMLASMIAAPWRDLGPLRVAFLVAGGAGLLYGALTLVRARRQRGYKPVLEDWIWHVVLPPMAYGALLVTGAVLESDIYHALFIAGAVELLLLVIGIHNAWDTVAYLAIERSRSRGRDPVPTPDRPHPGSRKSRRRRR